MEIRTREVRGQDLYDTYAYGKAYMKKTDLFTSVATAQTYLKSGPSMTLTVGKKVIAVIGTIMYSPRVGLIWARTTDRIHKHKIDFHKKSKEFLDHLTNTIKLNRIEALIDEDFKESLRWVKSLGFVEEGLLKRIGPNGENCYIVAYLP